MDVAASVLWSRTAIKMIELKLHGVRKFWCIRTRHWSQFPSQLGSKDNFSLENDPFVYLNPKVTRQINEHEQTLIDQFSYDSCLDQLIPPERLQLI